MSLVAYVLKEELKARPPTRWDSHVRCAIRLPDEEIQLPVGTWLLELPTSTGNSQAALYQLANGIVVCIDKPLTADQVDPLTDAQALISLSSFRTLTQAMRDDHGLAFEPVSGDAPFRIIQCPLCRGTAFTTVAFSSVWCDSCNAKFSVRYTSGLHRNTGGAYRWEGQFRTCWLARLCSRRCLRLVFLWPRADCL
jgi:hypothetical protein